MEPSTGACGLEGGVRIEEYADPESLEPLVEILGAAARELCA